MSDHRVNSSLLPDKEYNSILLNFITRYIVNFHQIPTCTSKRGKRFFKHFNLKGQITHTPPDLGS